VAFVFALQCTAQPNRAPQSAARTQTPATFASDAGEVFSARRMLGPAVSAGAGIPEFAGGGTFTGSGGALELRIGTGIHLEDLHPLLPDEFGVRVILLRTLALQMCSFVNHETGAE
jgi:hypothetical protein